MLARRFSGAGLRRGIRGSRGGGGGGSAPPVITSPPTLDSDPSTILASGLVQFTPAVATGEDTLEHHVYVGGVLVDTDASTYVWQSSDIGPSAFIRAVATNTGGLDTEDSSARAWTPETPGDLWCGLGSAVVDDGSGNCSRWIDLSARGGIGSPAHFDTASGLPLINASDANYGGAVSVEWGGVARMLDCVLAASTHRFLHDGTGRTVVAAVRTGTNATAVVIDTCSASAGNIGMSLLSRAAANADWQSVIGNGGAHVATGDSAVATSASSTRYNLIDSYASAASPVHALRSNGSSVISVATETATPASGDAVGSARLGRTQSNQFQWSGTMACLLLYDADVRAHAADIDSWLTWAQGEGDFSW